MKKISNPVLYTVIAAVFLAILGRFLDSYFISNNFNEKFFKYYKVFFVVLYTWIPAIFAFIFARRESIKLDIFKKLDKRYFFAVISAIVLAVFVTLINILFEKFSFNNFLEKIKMYTDNYFVSFTILLKAVFFAATVIFLSLTVYAILALGNEIMWFIRQMSTFADEDDIALT